MSRGPPHRYNPTGERSFRGYPPRYGEFSGSSGYGYYGGPPYKRQRRVSDDDIGPPPVNYGPAFYDPPYVRHQEVGLGEFNDFSSVSVEKDLKIHERDGNPKDYERSEVHVNKPQSSTESSGLSSQHQSTSASSSPHSTKQSPRFSPHHSPIGRPSPPPPSSTSASQPLFTTTSQPSSSFSKVLLSSSSDEGALTVGKHHPLRIVCPTPSESVPSFYPVVRDKLKDGKGRPSIISSLSPSGGLQKKQATYSGPTVEAISPSAPGLEANVDKDDGEKKPGMDEPADILSKDELLQGMEKVDREIAQVIQQINNFKKMQKQLEDEASKEPDEPQKEEPPAPEPKPKSIVEIIYDENKRKAEAAQARLAKLGFPLPDGKLLYNQPSDLPCYHENLRRAPAIKAKLVKYFQLRKHAKEVKNRQLCKEYKTLKQAWLKKMERHENNPKRKHKETKLREFYEKVFPEIKKQREQTERFTRMGSRSNWGIVARSEAEFNEIVDNLNEQEANERHMRTLAVEPPPLLDKEERRVKFINRNGLIRDPLAILSERKHKNIWTDKERRTFKDKFIHNPKDFDLISSFLPGKSVADCILFYYQTKKKEHYKQLSRRHNLKKRRRDPFGAGAPSSKARVGATESSAKGDRGGSEGEDDLEEMTDSAEESEENEEPTQPPVTTAHVTTPTPSARRPDHVETSRWSEKEIEIALQGLKDYGRDWEAIARRVMTKTGAQCKNFYFNYKKKLQLELLVAEHERTKIQRAQQQQQQKQQQQQQPSLPQQHPQQREVSEKHDSTSKQNLVPQASDSYTSNPSNQHSMKTTHSSSSGVCSSTSTAGTVNTSVRPTGNPSTATTTNSVTSIQLGSARVMPSHSHLTSSSSTLFMPTPGVIASIGRASSNLGTAQPGQIYFRSSLSESKKHDTLHPSRSPHPGTIVPGLVYPRAVDASRPRPEFLVSSRAGNPLSESHPLYQASSVHKTHPLSTSLQPSSSTNTQSTKGVLHLGSSHAITSLPSHVFTSHPVSHAITSHPLGSQCVKSQSGSFDRTSDSGTSHTCKPHSGESYERSFHPSEASHVPAGSIVFTPSGPSSNALNQRSRPASHSPVIVSPQDKPHNPVSSLKDASGGDQSLHKPTYLSTHTGSIRGESAGRSIKPNEGRRDINPEPDVIVIDADEQRKIAHPRLEAAEGNQASSMLRRLASTGNAEQMPTTVEPVRPKSLPLSSGTYFTESRIQHSATPPGSSSAGRHAVLNPPPPLIQMSSSRDKKYTGAQDLTKESSRPREGFVHTKPYPERYIKAVHATSSGGDIPLHPHTREENRGSEAERRTPVIETVDLTRDREGSTSSRTRPASGSPIVPLGASSARDRLQAMAMHALVETNDADVTEKIVQKKREETFLPPRTPDPKLSVYEQTEAIRKFNALGNVVSASREFPAGGEYPTQPYAVMAMQTQHQQHVHPHSVGTSSPPPYAYPFHVGHPITGFHRHPEHHFLVPVGVHQILSHSVNGDDLPGHLKVGGAFAHQYPQAPSYFSTGIRSLLPTYQPVTVYGHRYPVPLGEERHPLHRPHEVSVRRPNDISEQDLANPFVIKQLRHTHSPVMPERVASPGELPKFPVPSHSPAEPTKRPSSFSPDMKPQVSHAEVGKTVSPPAGSYLSQIPSRPASVSEMRNRAAVIPELQDTTAVSQSFPHPQPVLLPSNKDHNRESRVTEQTSDGAKKEHAQEDKGSSMSAFATLVDVAAAAPKVDIPFSAKEKPESPVFVGENIGKKETNELHETSSSCHARLGGLSIGSPARVTSSPRTSPGISSAPRYGITTGLVPKPPPLMPITGVRPMQEGSCATSTPLSVSVGGHVSVSASRSPSKLSSPPETRARGSISPDGPPPLISRSVISPTGLPPPLIRGMVSPVPTTLRSPESHADSTTVKIISNQDGIPRQRPDQTFSVSDKTFQKGGSIVDQDCEQKVWINRPVSPPTSSQRVNSDDATRARFPGHSQVRTIVETKMYLDSGHAEMTRQHREALQLPTGTLLEDCLQMPSSSSTLVAETKETTMGSISRLQTTRENDKDTEACTQPEQTSFASNHSEEVREMVQERWQVSQVYSTKSETPTNEDSAQAAISHVSDSGTEEGDEVESDPEDEEPKVHSSSAGLHPRVRALVRSSQSNPQPSYYDASDSETLSAEESEALPESSDELFPGPTMKQLSQPENCESRRDVDHDIAEREISITADTSFAHMNVPVLGVSREYPDDGDGNTEIPHMQSAEIMKRHGLEETVTSTGTIFQDLLDFSSQKLTADLPTTSTIPDETRHQMDKRDGGEEEKKLGTSLVLEIREEASVGSDQELTPSQSSPSGETVVEQDTSEALPAQSYQGLYEEDAVRVHSSGGIVVGSSETNLATTAFQVESSLGQILQDIPDSSDNLQQIPDISESSSTEKQIDDIQIALDDADSMTINGTNVMISSQSVTEMEDNSSVKVSDTRDSYICQSTSKAERENEVSAVLNQTLEEDEGVNEADPLEKPVAERSFLQEADTYSCASDNNPPEISSAMDDVSDEGDHLSYPTFIGEFVPLPGTVDSPDIRSGCSNNITSEESSVCDENMSEREIKEIFEPAPSNQGDICSMLSPDEGNNHTDDTLSEGEIPPSQESNQTDDDLASVSEKSVNNEATAVVRDKITEKPHTAWHCESSQAVTVSDQLPSQNKESVDDQLSEGEIPESDDEPTVDANVFPVISSSGGDSNRTGVSSRRTSVVCSSQEDTSQTDCYINMIPISPAPPESPSQESQSDRASPLPSWQPADNQYSSVVSLSLATRITPFPYSTLSINVGSASSSARSSPVPQALAVSLAPGSSPSSSSLLTRPPEPAPLLSDNYEPLSDDDDGMADASKISDEKDHI